MEFWIRSQDKEKLLKANDIGISNNTINEGGSIKFKGYKIVGYFDKNTEYEILGTYKTKKRAIEVLDEIQNILKPKMIVNTYKVEQAKLCDGTQFIQPMLDDIQVQNATTYVYEMPEK